MRYLTNISSMFENDVPDMFKMTLALRKNESLLMEGVPSHTEALLTLLSNISVMG